MKTPTKKVAKPAKKAVNKKKVVTTVPEHLIKGLEERVNPTEPVIVEVQSKPKYTATFRMGSIVETASGEDESIFSALKPSKITNKVVFTLLNNENNKSTELVFVPHVAKKMLSSLYMQKFQWKRIVGKVA